MADRLQYQAPFVPVKTMPDVRVDTGAAQYMSTITNAFITVSNEAHKRQLAADLEMAKTEGQRVGYNTGKDFKPAKPDSLFARQYNETGIATALQVMQTDTQKASAEYLQKFPMNPKGLSAALTKYKEGYLAEVAPEMQTSVAMHMDKLNDAYIAKAQANLKAYNAQLAAVQAARYERQMENTLENVAPDMFQGGAASAKANEAVAQLRQQYINTLAHHGPDADYTVAGYTVKGSGVGSGALSPLEVYKKMDAFDRKVISAGSFGHFVREVDAGRGVDAYMNFLKGNMEVTTVNKDGKLESMKISDYLTNDEMSELGGKMRSYFTGIDSMEGAVHAKWQRGVERMNQQLFREAITSAYQTQDDGTGNQVIVGGDPVALQNTIAKALQNPLVKPETIDKLQSLQKVLGATGQYTNPMVEAATDYSIATGAITNAEELPVKGLSDATKIRMVQDMEARNAGRHWSTSHPYRNAHDYAEATLAPAKSAGFNLFSDADKDAAADMAEFNKRFVDMLTNASRQGILPSDPNAPPMPMTDGRRQLDIYDAGKMIADEIAARRIAPKSTPAVQKLESQIETVKNQMDNPTPDTDIESIKKQYRELNKKLANEKAKGSR